MHLVVLKGIVVKTHIQILTLLSFLCLNATAYSASITNGNFEPCSLSGWSKDTDLLGDLGSSEDFTVVGSPGDCAASINVDFFETQGDFTSPGVTEVFVVNTLFQTLDLSADPTSFLRLDIALRTFSQLVSLDPFFLPDYFLVNLVKAGTPGQSVDETGTTGNLVADTLIDGDSSMTYSFDLDRSFNNQTDWLLEFQVFIGVDDFGDSDAFGSSLLIESVSLTEVKAVNAPSVSSALALVFGLMLMRRKFN